MDFCIWCKEKIGWFQGVDIVTMGKPILNQHGQPRVNGFGETIRETKSHDGKAHKTCLSLYKAHGKEYFLFLRFSNEYKEEIPAGHIEKIWYSNCWDKEAAKGLTYEKIAEQLDVDVKLLTDFTDFLLKDGVLIIEVKK